MKKYMFMAGLFSLTLLACSDDDISSAQSDSGSSTIENNSSSSTSDLERSSSLLEESSSSLEKVSSSSKLEISSSSSFHPLCKVSGDWGSRGECSEIWPRGDGDLWSNGDLKVNTSIYIDDTASFGERAVNSFSKQIPPKAEDHKSFGAMESMFCRNLMAFSMPLSNW